LIGLPEFQESEAAPTTCPVIEGQLIQDRFGFLHHSQPFFGDGLLQLTQLPSHPAANMKLADLVLKKEFVDKCESLGLYPMPVKGCHVAVADGVFAQLLGELGVERPDMPPTMDALRIDWIKFLSDLEGKKQKGTSTLKVWCCPECGLNVRMGTEFIHLLPGSSRQNS